MTQVLSDRMISAVRAGDMEALAKLDAHGLPPAPDEDAEHFASRLERLQAAREHLYCELKSRNVVEPAPGIRLTADAAIPNSILQDAWDLVQALYDVKPDWAPGFFANESFGFLWGGCALSDPESGLDLFIIRKNFRKKRRWLVYDRRELLAHELCHTAHQALNEWQFEEYFAYRTADARLRRWFGNCFVRKYDAWGFLGPVLLLPLAQILRLADILHWPMGFFWGLAAVYPIYLSVRNMATQNRARRARRELRRRGVGHPDAVLFRMTAREIGELAAGRMPTGNDLRWRLLERRLAAK